MIKNARIGKLSDGRYRVYSHDGKNLGTCTSYEAAKKRLAEVEAFKHMDKSKRKSAFMSLMNIYSFAEKTDVITTYSAVMRDLRKNNPDKVKDFMKSFKEAFDRAVDDNLDEAENAALLEAIQKEKLDDSTII
jgi:hypothetical protein